MEQYGNQATFNVELVLHKNIVDSEYYRDTCLKLSNWDEVVDEIYSTVGNVEPWMSGNARGGSTAFGLLFRLFNLKLTEDEVQGLIEHKDSPYIRAIGFLYLRYVCPPKSIWEWIEPYVQDREEFAPSGEDVPEGKVVTMGDFVRDIFLNQFYFETIFPRIPKPVTDEFVRHLTSMGLPTKAVGNAGQGGHDRRGVEDGNRRPASVKASLSVAIGQRAPNRANAREEGRGLGAGMKNTYGGSSNRSPKYSPQRSDQTRDREQSLARERTRDTDRDRERARDADRERDRPREADRRRDSEKERERDSDRYRSRDSSHHHRERDDDRSRGRGYESRDRSGGGYRGRDSRDDRHSGYPRKRSRSADRRERSPAKKTSGERDVRDVFRQAAPDMKGRVSQVKAVYG